MAHAFLKMEVLCNNWFWKMDRGGCVEQSRWVLQWGRTFCGGSRNLVICCCMYLRGKDFHWDSANFWTFIGYLWNVIRTVVHEKTMAGLKEVYSCLMLNDKSDLKGREKLVKDELKPLTGVGSRGLKRLQNKDITRYGIFTQVSGNFGFFSVSSVYGQPGIQSSTECTAQYLV